MLLSVADGTDARPYDLGTPVLRDVWVDPAHGRDSATGADRAHSLRSFTAAWGRVPADTAAAGTGYRIMLAAGNYTPDLVTSDGWTSDRHGTYRFPVEIVSADGARAAVIHRGLDFQDDRYLALIGLKFVTDPGADGGGNVVHVAASDHVLIRDCSLNGSVGTTRLAQETLKVNQVQDIAVEGCDIRGAFWFGLDFVAVEHGHIIGCSIHDTGDDVLLLKGGTAQILVEGNRVYDGAVTGIAAGQGAGFEFMVSPWLHYEAYDLKIVDNVVHDINNAGLAVRGGYNILMAHNTLYRVGLDQNSGSGLVLVAHGSRSLDNPADAAIVRAYHDAGGWGPIVQGVGSDPGEYIPNKHVYIFDNLIDNPAGVRTKYGHFDIADPVTPPPGWNIPAPSSATDDLQIRGNVIWNGPPGTDLGIGDPALAARVAGANAINTIQPDLVDPARGNFAPVAGGRIAGMASLAIPPFPGGDLPAHPLAPTGDLGNSVPLDAFGRVRGPATLPGAIDPGSTPIPGMPPAGPPLGRMAQVALALADSPAASSRLVVVAYVRHLGRAPSAREAAPWIARLGRRTTTEEQLAATLMGSAEYFRRKAHGSESAWIVSAFRTAMGRTPAGAERTAWLRQLGRGATRQGLAARLESAREARTGAIVALYRRLLGRSPRAAEVNAGLGLIASGRGDRRPVAVGLVASAEFYRDHGSAYAPWIAAAAADLGAPTH